MSDDSSAGPDAQATGRRPAPQERREDQPDSGARETEAAGGTRSTEPQSERADAGSRENGTSPPPGSSDGASSSGSSDCEAATGSTSTSDWSTVEEGTVSDPTDYLTRHWEGVDAIALFVIGAGVLLRSPGLLVAGAIGAVYAGYAGLAGPPRIHEGDEPVLSVTRRVSDRTPQPGDEVTVSVAVENCAEGLLTDVRVVDGVPDALSVVEGSPRHATALRPGARDTFSYDVGVVRGEHEWRPVHVVCADPSASVEREATVDAPTTIPCDVTLVSTSDVPLRELTTPYAGRRETATGGAGLEFFSTREYKSSDPLNRIDWHRRARTGEFGTVEFREERAARVVLLIDARAAAYCGPEPGAPHAVERSVAASARLAGPLLGDGNRVGLAAFGREDAWLPPGSGNEHRARLADLLSADPSLATRPPERPRHATVLDDRREELQRDRIARLEGRLPSDAQLIVLSPLCDELFAGVARRFDAMGHLVTVVSPDPTSRDTPGRQLAAMEREDRLQGLRASGLRVLDWERSESLSGALTRAEVRWST